MLFNAETQRTQRKRRERVFGGEGRTALTDRGKGRRQACPALRHMPVHACQRFFTRSARLGFDCGGGPSRTGRGDGSCRVGGGGGASQGWSPEKRMATPSKAYSRRTRWPSFFSMQIEKPGSDDAPLFDASSTSLSSTGE